MSGALDTLARVLAGAPGAASDLLPSCRAQAYGAEAFSGVAVAEMFARQPAALSPTPHVLAGPALTAVLDIDLSGARQAVFAETHEGRIGRLWRLGPGAPDPTAEPPLRFAQDPFMTQLRGPAAFDPRDHPNLSSSATRVLSAELATLLAPLCDARAIVLRAVSDGELAAALVSVATNAGDVSRVLSHRLAALFLRLDAERTVVSHAVWDEPWNVCARPRV